MSKIDTGLDTGCTFKTSQVLLLSPLFTKTDNRTIPDIVSFLIMINIELIRIHSHSLHSQSVSLQTRQSFHSTPMLSAASRSGLRSPGNPKSPKDASDHTRTVPHLS